MLTDDECVTEIGLTQAPTDGKEPIKTDVLWATGSFASMMTTELAKELGVAVLPITDPMFWFAIRIAPKRSIPAGRAEVFVWLDGIPLLHEFLVYDLILPYPSHDIVLGLDFITKGKELQIRHNGQCHVLNFFYNS